MPPKFSILDIASHRSDVTTSSWPDKVFRAPRTLVVSKERSALGVAVSVEHLDPSLIIVTQSDVSPAVEGIIVPAMVIERVKMQLGQVGVKTFADAVKEIEKEGDRTGKYHHEWLNQLRTGDYWCVKFNHFSASSPCSEHGTVCEPL